MNENPLQGWHLRKEITVGQILSIIAVIIGFGTWMMTIETRIAVIENDKVASGDRIDRLEIRVDNDLSEIKTSLRRIEDKLYNNK